MSERVYKIRLILHYAKIRFRRFWKEWGISKREFLEFVAAFGLVILILNMVTVAAFVEGLFF